MVLRKLADYLQQIKLERWLIPNLILACHLLTNPNPSPNSVVSCFHYSNHSISTITSLNISLHKCKVKSNPAGVGSMKTCSSVEDAGWKRCSSSIPDVPLLQLVPINVCHIYISLWKHTFKHLFLHVCICLCPGVWSSTQITYQPSWLWQ